MEDSTNIILLVGLNVPILVQLDIHSNVSQKMVDQASVLLGRKSYPEIDMAERSRECADILMRILKDGFAPNTNVLGDESSDSTFANAGSYC